MSVIVMHITNLLWMKESKIKLIRELKGMLLLMRLYWTTRKSCLDKISNQIDLDVQT